MSGAVTKTLEKGTPLAIGTKKKLLKQILDSRDNNLVKTSLLPRLQNLNRSGNEHYLLPSFKCYDAFSASKQVNAYVSYVKSCDEIYINVINATTAMFDSVIKQMLSYYNGSGKQPFSAQLGKAVAVYNVTDNEWHRGEISNIMHTENDGVQVTAFMVDFGTFMVVPESRCRELLPRFLDLPALAHKVCLCNVMPVPPHVMWPAETTEELKKLISNKLVAVARIMTADEKPVPSVAIQVTHNDKEIIINQYLVEKELAFCRLPASQTEQESIAPESHEIAMCSKQESSETNLKTVHSKPDSKEEDDLFAHNMMAEDYKISFLKDDAVSMWTGGYQAQDEKKICYLFKKTGACNRKWCTWEHRHLNPYGYTTDTRQVYAKAFNDISLPGVHMAVKFKITEFASVTDFYAILTHENISVDEDPDGNGSIADLVGMINNPKELSKMKYFDEEYPAVGQIVLAKAKDGFFYRARVMELDDDHDQLNIKVQVVFVDYGTEQWIELRNLRIIENKFLHLPFQAVNITIMDFVEKDEEKARAKFLKMVSKYTFTGTVTDTQIGRLGWHISIMNARIGETTLKSIFKDLVEPIEYKIIRKVKTCIVVPG